MKKQVSRISILQSSKIITALYALFGFLYTLIGVPLLIFGEGAVRIQGVVFIFMPLFMGIMGFIFFAVVAGLYNLLAKVLGGIEVEVEDQNS